MLGYDEDMCINYFFFVNIYFTPSPKQNCEKNINRNDVNIGCEIVQMRKAQGQRQKPYFFWVPHTT